MNTAVIPHLASCLRKRLTAPRMSSREGQLHQNCLKVGIAQIVFLLYSILKSQSLTPVIFMTKEYSDMSLCMGGKIRL